MNADGTNATATGRAVTEAGRAGTEAETAAAIPLAHGHALRLADDGQEQSLRLFSRDGHCGLEIRITPSGPVLRLVGEDVRLSVSGRLQIEADELNLRGRDAVNISSDGEIRSRGDQQWIQSERGDIRLRANDDVRLEGERVRVNC